MKIVRGRLDASDVANPSQRYHISGGVATAQYSPDNGTTWVDTPTLDPRSSSIFLKPASTTPNFRCTAATREVRILKNSLEFVINLVQAAQVATAILNELLLPLGGIGVMVDIVMAGFDLLVTYGISAIDAAFTDAVWNDIQCIIYQRISANGQMSQSQLDSILSDISIKHPGAVTFAMNIIFYWYGYVLLSNGSVTLPDAPDCDPCPACVAFLYNYSLPLPTGVLSTNGSALMGGRYWGANRKATSQPAGQCGTYQINASTTQNAGGLNNERWSGRITGVDCNNTNAIVNSMLTFDLGLSCDVYSVSAYFELNAPTFRGAYIATYDASFNQINRMDWSDVMTTWTQKTLSILSPNTRYIVIYATAYPNSQVTGISHVEINALPT